MTIFLRHFSTAIVNKETFLFLSILLSSYYREFPVIKVESSAKKIAVDANIGNRGNSAGFHSSTAKHTNAARSGHSGSYSGKEVGTVIGAEIPKFFSLADELFSSGGIAETLCLCLRSKSVSAAESISYACVTATILMENYPQANVILGTKGICELILERIRRILLAAATSQEQTGQIGTGTAFSIEDILRKRVLWRLIQCLCACCDGCCENKERVLSRKALDFIVTTMKVYSTTPIILGVCSHFLLVCCSDDITRVAEANSIGAKEATKHAVNVLNSLPENTGVKTIGINTFAPMGLDFELDRFPAVGCRGEGPYECYLATITAAAFQMLSQ